MDLKSKLSNQTLNKLAMGMTTGEIDLTGEELILCLAFIIGSEIKRNSPLISQLRSKYKSPTGKTSPTVYYSKMMYPDIINKNSSAIKLFWDMYHDMNDKLVFESIVESFSESLNECKNFS